MGNGTRKQIVLLVEDNPSDRALVVHALRAYPIVVVEAEDGDDAVDYLFRRNKFSSRPQDEILSLIILDLQLPKRDGLAVLHFIRGIEETNRTPVVFFSGFGNPKTFATANSYQAAEVLVKPTSGEDFITLIQGLATKYCVNPFSPPAAPGDSEKSQPDKPPLDTN